MTCARAKFMSSSTLWSLLKKPYRVSMVVGLAATKCRLSSSRMPLCRLTNELSTDDTLWSRSLSSYTKTSFARTDMLCNSFDCPVPWDLIHVSHSFTQILIERPVAFLQAGSIYVVVEFGLPALLDLVCVLGIDLKMNIFRDAYRNSDGRRNSSQVLLY